MASEKIPFKINVSAFGISAGESVMVTPGHFEEGDILIISHMGNNQLAQLINGKLVSSEGNTILEIFGVVDVEKRPTEIINLARFKAKRKRGSKSRS